MMSAPCNSRRVRTWLTGVGLIAALLPMSCADAYPEVVVVNNTDEQVLIRDISFNGCLWNVVLAHGEATAPQRCPPGSDRIHFKKFDAAKYCAQRAQDGEPDGICAGEFAMLHSVTPTQPKAPDNVPLWFNYQTREQHQAEYGDFKKIEILAGDMEQDFSIPGPYGH